MKKSTIAYVVGSVVAAASLFAPKGTFTSVLRDKPFEAKVVQHTTVNDGKGNTTYFLLVQKDDGSLQKVWVDYERYAYLENDKRVRGRYSVFGTHVIDGLVTASSAEPDYMPRYGDADVIQEALGRR